MRRKPLFCPCIHVQIALCLLDSPTLRDIVKASHLSPLDRKDIVGATRKQPWNPVAAHSTSTGSGPGGQRGGDRAREEDGSLTQQKPPQNAQEFTLEWRKLKQGSVTSQYQ